MWEVFAYWFVSHYIVICLMLIWWKFMDNYVATLSGKVDTKLTSITPATAIIPAFGLAVDPEKFWFYIVCIVAILMGSALRLGILYRNDQLSWKAVGLQFLFTIPICFIGYNIWDFYQSNLPIHILLFFLSLFSIFIASITDSVGKIGIRASVNQALKYLSAKLDEKDEK